jgi:excisionase family DNA binding protein
MKTTDNDRALTVKDVAELLSVDQKTIYRLAQKGGIPGFKVLGSWRFQRNDIVNWINDQKQITSKK